MTRFLHVRNIEDSETGTHACKGGATVAYDVVDGVVQFAVAICSTRDNFCRRIGRAVSEGRLKDGHKVMTLNLNGQKPIQVILESLYA